MLEGSQVESASGYWWLIQRDGWNQGGSLGLKKLQSPLGTEAEVEERPL